MSSPGRFRGRQTRSGGGERIRQSAEAVTAQIAAKAWPFCERAWTTLAPNPDWRTPCFPDGWAGALD